MKRNLTYYTFSDTFIDGCHLHVLFFPLTVCNLLSKMKVAFDLSCILLMICCGVMTIQSEASNYENARMLDKIIKKMTFGKRSNSIKDRTALAELDKLIKKMTLGKRNNKINAKKSFASFRWRPTDGEHRSRENLNSIC